MSAVISRPGSTALGQLLAIDPGGAADPARVRLLAQRLLEAELFAAEVEGALAGYAIRGRLFGHDFVELLYVAPATRRSGVGSCLMRALEAARRGDRVFVSTNRSNGPMRALLSREGWAASGALVNLDADDPELFFVKRFDRVRLEAWPDTLQVGG